MIHHCLKELFEIIISKNAQRHLDNVVQQWIGYPKQCNIKNYVVEFTRLIFPDGVTSITNISASTKVGILFAILISSLTKDGINVFLNNANLSNTQL